MHLPIAIILAGVCPLLGLAAPHAGTAQPRSSVIKGKYIVALKPESTPEQLVKHTSWAQSVHARNLRKIQLSSGVKGTAGASGVERTFSAVDGFRAYSGSFDEETIEEIKRSEDVVCVEPNRKLTLDFINQPEGDDDEEPIDVWGLDRISHRETTNYGGGNKHTYASDPSATGRGQFAYVIDTGIQANHTEFEGRVVKGFNLFEDERVPFEDDDGHGTHVAGTIGGRTVGVAREVTLVDVKALSTRDVLVEDLITCIEWAVNDILKNERANSSVINMSFTWILESDIMSQLITKAYEQGVVPVAAAGNHDKLIKTDTPPGSVPRAFTVGAVDCNDQRTEFSNFGPVIDVFAPGLKITSARMGRGAGYTEMDGTSMAAAYVTGLVAYLRTVDAEAPYVSAAAITQRIKDLALKGVVKDAQGSPNLLVNNNSGA